MAENVVKDKSYKFAVRVVGLYKYLANEKKEYVLSRQLLRAGTSIGANIKEATQAESRADFIHKMAIALKEASETEYWLELLKETGFSTKNTTTRFKPIARNCSDCSPQSSNHPSRIHE
jgi:four helix bundle protein